MNKDLGNYTGLKEQKIPHGHKNATKTKESASRKFDEETFRLGNTAALQRLKIKEPVATLCRLQRGKKKKNGLQAPRLSPASPWRTALQNKTAGANENGLQAPRLSPASPWRTALQNKTAGANVVAQSAPLSKETSQEMKVETRQSARVERHLAPTKPVRQTTIRWQDITSQSQNDFEVDKRTMLKLMWEGTAKSRNARRRKYRPPRNKCVPITSTDSSTIVKDTWRENAKLAVQIVDSGADPLHRYPIRGRNIDVTKARASSEIKLDSLSSPTVISKKVSDILDHVDNKNRNENTIFIDFKIPCARYGKKILPSL